MNRSISIAAQALLAARRSGRIIDDLPPGSQPQTRADAYAIQDEVGKALTPVVGWKVSRRPDGALVSGALYEETILTDETLAVAGVNQPLVEVESAFRIRAPIASGASDDELLSKIDFVPLFEIVHSRYKDLFKVTPLSLLADNMAAGFIKLGAPVERWQNIPADKLNLRLTVAGKIIEEFNFADKMKAGVGLALAILRGDDGRSRSLDVGRVITTGSMNKPAAVIGDIVADYGPLGVNTITLQ